MPFDDKKELDISGDAFSIISRYISKVYTFATLVVGLLAVLMVVV